MANHKRKRPRNRRGGCKLCKPWKVNGFRTERADGERFSDHRRRAAADETIRLAPRRIREFARPQYEGTDEVKTVTIVWGAVDATESQDKPGPIVYRSGSEWW